VDVSKSFPLLSFRTIGTIYNVDDLVRAKLTSPSELTLSLYGATSVGTVEWQVVTFDDAMVQTNDLPLGPSTLIVTDTVQAVDPNRSLLLVSYGDSALGNTNASQMVWSGRISSSTLLTFERRSGGPAGMLTYHLVTFTNDSTVQSGHQDVAAASDTAVVNLLSGVALDRSLALASGLYQRISATDFSGSADLSFPNFTFELTGSSTLTMQRGVTGGSNGAAQVDWQVVQFQ
jgi:hypothetical protein